MMVATKPRISKYLIPLLGVVPVIAVIGVMIVSASRAATAPINLDRVRTAVIARFGVAYDWGCQVQSVPNRTVICQSQPNTYYSVIYYVQSNGTPTLETSDPPPDS